MHVCMCVCSRMASIIVNYCMHFVTTTVLKHPVRQTNKQPTNKQTTRRYNRLCGAAKKIATRLSKLDHTDPFRLKRSDLLLEKLFSIGLIPTQKNLGLVDKVR
jgi:hypothetical protein